MVDPLLLNFLEGEPPLLRDELTRLAVEVAMVSTDGEHVDACCLGIVPSEAVRVMLATTPARLIVVGWSRASPARDWVVAAPYKAVTGVSEPAVEQRDPAWLIVSGYRIRLTSPPDRARSLLDLVRARYRLPVIGEHD